MNLADSGGSLITEANDIFVVKENNPFGHVLKNVGKNFLPWALQHENLATVFRFRNAQAS
jgi:hypothetical protein